MSYPSQTWLTKFLRSVLKEELIEEIEGDLLELYDEWLAEHSARKAKWLYLYHAAKFIRPYSLKSPFGTFTKNSNLMLKTHFKVAFRQLTKHKAYAFLNIGGLAAALVILSLISLWIWDEASWDVYHPHRSQVAQVMQNQTFDEVDIQTWNSQAKQLAPALRQYHGDLFQHISMSNFPNRSTLFIEERAIKRTGLFMEPSGPHILGLRMIKGSTNSLEEFNSLIISQSTARACFGDQDPINQTIRIGNLPELLVKGVYEDLPANASFSEIDYVGSWALYETTLPDWVGWGNSWFQCFVQINENQQMAAVSDAIKQLKYELVPADEGKRFDPELFLHPMEKWHLYEEFEQGKNIGGRIQYVWLFGIIAVCVLILACINFMNLSTARSEKRAKEVGLRKVMGSVRKQLVTQFFVESLTVSFLAFGVALAVCQLLLPLFNELMQKDLSIPWSLPSLWLIGLSIILITGLLAGSYPALYLSSFSPIKALKTNFLPAKHASYPRRALTLMQFTVSVSLIISTLFVFLQIQHVKERDLGYNMQGLVMVPISSPELKGDYEIFRRDLLATGLIEEVSSAGSLITNTFITNSGFDWPGKDPDREEEFVTITVDHEFGKMMGWEVMSGQDFLGDMKADGTYFILNETAVEYIGVEDPIGLPIRRDEDEHQVVGVVKDIITQSPYEKIRPMLFMLQEENLGFAYLRLAENQDFAKAIATVQDIYQQYEAAYPFEYRIVGDLHAKKFQTEETVGTLSGVFTFLAILISCLGLYGMSLFVAERRTKEIGIRKVLGASVPELWAKLAKEFVWLTLVSCLLASGLAYYFVKDWMTQYEYHTELSPWVFVASSLLALVIALGTVSYHTIRVASVNPVQSLRAE